MSFVNEVVEPLSDVLPEYIVKKNGCPWEPYRRKESWYSWGLIAPWCASLDASSQSKRALLIFLFVVEH